MIAYIEHLKEFEKSRGFLELRSKFSMISGFKVNIQILIVFHMVIMNNLDAEKFLNTIYNNSKREKTRYKSFQIIADSVYRKLQNTNKRRNYWVNEYMWQILLSYKKRTKWWCMQQHELIFKTVCWKKEVRHKRAHYFAYQMQN